MKKIVVLVLIALSLTCKGQHDHGGGHEEEDNSSSKEILKHGGEIVYAGKYNLEVLINPMQKSEKLIVYVLKKNNKEVELKEASAKIVMKYKDGRTDSLLMELQNGRFTAEKIDLTKSVNIFFSVRVGKKTASGVYYNEGLIKK